MLSKVQKESIETEIRTIDSYIAKYDALPDDRRTAKSERENAWDVVQKARLKQMLFLGIITYTF